MSGTVIESLLVQFGVDVDDPSFKDATKAYTNLHFMATDLVAILGKLGDAIVTPIREVAKLGNETFLTGVRLGAGVEQLQQWRQVAELTGVDTHALTLGIERLGRSAYAAANTVGGNQARAFKKLGVDIYDTNKQLKSSSALFSEMILKLGDIKDVSTREGVAFALMGRGAGQLLPMLAQGAEYLAAVADEVQKAGAIMGPEAVQNARDLSFWWGILNLHLRGLMIRLGSGLLPLANRVVATFQKWVDVNRDFINTGIDHLIKRFSDVMVGAVRMGYAFIDTLKGIADYVGGVNNLLDILGGVVLAVLTTALAGATAAVIKFAGSLLLAGIGPLLFGLMVAQILILIQDLTATDSLLKEIFNTMPQPDDHPVVKFLKSGAMWANALFDSLMNTYILVSNIGGPILKLMRFGATMGTSAFYTDDSLTGLWGELIDGWKEGRHLQRVATDLRIQDQDRALNIPMGAGKGMSATVNVTQNIEAGTDPKAHKDAAKKAYQAVFNTFNSPDAKAAEAELSGSAGRTR